ncbi:hypothetical protein VSX64_03935 [Aurantimonas sp. C2-6-R+9]|uniref:hypothetical protein n=1 Tax=unclassified Aurantimonas TaxID=2638230 RepID=UPI002E196648|nr:MULTISPECIES: hypothetical protein [unclassified Aurantimonas]MEC5289824.1 hypothetical protein [Aurantimonas sp. C2-3-R2]MEC5380035.1 hypothetical protein [Aurantimonas sp. C2-6-R+9]MEC5410906.1 hypothetical protein [Aurantimonas sp. C2-4-R8]
MSRFSTAILAALLALPAAPVLAQQTVGVALSNREKRVAVPVRLPDGRMVLRTRNSGVPWLYGVGSTYGKASGLPLIGGVTPSIIASTPSGGLVPGQEPE